MMTGNTDLNATSDAVGSTTIADLLTWAETRKGQIEAAKTAYTNAVEADETNGTTDFKNSLLIFFKFMIFKRTICINIVNK